MSEAGAAARVGSVYAAQEWGRLQFFLEQLGKVCSSLAGMRMAGLSPWEVTSSLSCRHKEKGAGVSRGEAGDHHSPGCPGSRSRRGSRCHPSRQACQGHSQLGPCPGWTTQPMGPSCPPSPPLLFLLSLSSCPSYPPALDPIPLTVRPPGPRVILLIEHDGE